MKKMKSVFANTILILMCIFMSIVFLTAPFVAIMILSNNMQNGIVYAESYEK